MRFGLGFILMEGDMDDMKISFKVEITGLEKPFAPIKIAFRLKRKATKDTKQCREQQETHQNMPDGTGAI